MNKRLFENYSYYLPGVRGMFALFLMFLLGAVLGNIVALPLYAILPAESVTDWVAMISYPVMFIPPMLYARSKSKSASVFNNGLAVDSNNFGHLGIAKMSLIVSGMTIATAIAAEPISSLLPETPEWFEQIMQGTTGGNFILSFITVSLFAPLFEEWLCRGVVLRGLLTKMRPAGAIAISAAFFAILHMNPWQALPAFLLGILFGYVYYKTGSLKLTMLMHCVNNTMAVVFSKIPSLEEAEGFADVLSPWAYAGVLVACVAFVAATAIVLRNIPFSKDDARSNCDEIPPMTI